MTAIPLLEAALASRSEEALRIRTHGVHFVDYLPHLYLAYAHWLAGNPHTAGDTWRPARRAAGGSPVRGRRRALGRHPDDAARAGARSHPLRLPPPLPRRNASCSSPQRPPALPQAEYERLRRRS